MSMRAPGGANFTIAGLALAYFLRLRWYTIFPLMLAWTALSLICRALRLIPRHPIPLASIATTATITHINPMWLPAALFATLIALSLWHGNYPDSFRRHIAPRLRGWKRATRTYRWGWPTWRRTMKRCRIAKDGVPLPWLMSVHSTPYVDKLRVKVPTGHDETAFQEFRADLLQWGWRAQSVRVFNPQPKRQALELWNLIEDPLTNPVPPFPQPTEALPRQGLPLMLQEDGEPWLWKIRGGAAHMFVCGISGAGKGSVIGAIIDALQKAVGERKVELWGIDPQASELGMWRHVFTKLVYTQKAAASMLEELATVMDKRTRSMFGVSRQHQPAPDDPLYVLIADEGLDLLDKKDRETYKRILSGFSRLTRQGRKASIVVVFISQRAELELVEIRKDFPNAIALQLNMENDVDMVLGRGALATGARAHEITTPGVGYVAMTKGIVRGRFPYQTDDYVREVPPAPGNEDPENMPAPPKASRIGGFA